MITIVQSPTLNDTLPDGNTNKIIFNSDEAATTYFRLEIKVNDVLFNTKSIARNTNGDSTFDFKGFYDFYFQDLVNFSLAPGMVAHPQLKVKLSVSIKEYILSDDSLNTTEVLPDFYILKSTKTTQIPDDVFAILELPSLELQCPQTEAINIPLFIKPETITVQVFGADAGLLHQEDIIIAASNFYTYTVNLGSLAIPQFTPYITVKFVVGTFKKAVSIHLLKDTIYPVKPIFYKNNFGLYLKRYLHGQFFETGGFSPKKYIQQDKTTKTYEINESANFVLNTGFNDALLHKEVIAIAKSVSVYLLLENVWTYVNASTKKVSVFKDNQFVYEDELKFNKVIV